MESNRQRLEKKSDLAEKNVPTVEQTKVLASKTKRSRKNTMKKFMDGEQEISPADAAYAYLFNEGKFTFYFKNIENGTLYPKEKGEELSKTNLLIQKRQVISKKTIMNRNWLKKKEATLKKQRLSTEFNQKVTLRESTLDSILTHKETLASNREAIEGAASNTASNTMIKVISLSASDPRNYFGVTCGTLFETAKKNLASSNTSFRKSKQLSSFLYKGILTQGVNLKELRTIAPEFIYTNNRVSFKETTVVNPVKLTPASTDPQCNYLFGIKPGTLFEPTEEEEKEEKNTFCPK